MADRPAPSCDWHPPGTLAHDLAVLVEAFREVGRQAAIAFRSDMDAIAHAWRRVIEEVAHGA